MHLVGNDTPRRMGMQYGGRNEAGMELQELDAAASSKEFQ